MLNLLNTICLLLSTAVSDSSAAELIQIGTDAWKKGVLDSLDIMWKGVLAIFIVITVVIIAVLILNKVTAPKKDKTDGE